MNLFNGAIDLLNGKPLILQHKSHTDFDALFVKFRDAECRGGFKNPLYFVGKKDFIGVFDVPPGNLGFIAYYHYFFQT